MPAVDDPQRHLLDRLRDLLDGDSSPRNPLRMAYGLCQRRPPLSRCSRVADHYRALTQPRPESADSRRFVLPAYPGRNPTVLRIIRLLTENGADRLFQTAILHGSLATLEEIAYSDFDGVVVLSDSCLKHPADLRLAATLLRAAVSCMWQHDPLQHHGWLVLAPSHLARYPEDILPLAAYESAVALSPNPTELTVRPVPSADRFRTSFTHLAGAIQQRVRSRRSTRNLYELKCTLSLFMLLPALYLQAKNGRGIDKAASFAAARGDFTENEWKPMDQASHLRTIWPEDCSNWASRLGLIAPPLRGHLMRHFSRPIPADISPHVTPSLFSSIHALADAMLERVTHIK